MKILSVQTFPRRELLTRLAGTRLRGHGQVRPYQGCHLELAEATDPATLAPAQNYVLRPGIQRILRLREALLAEGVDIFALDGGAHVRTSDDPERAVPVLPPVVEESKEPDGRTVLIINDGIHRIHAARALGLPISVVAVYGVPPEYPYYAYALPGGWSDVVELDELPDTWQKKDYREPDQYRSLYRDFNEVFPGVQEQRKQSNPGHIVG